MRVTEWKGLLMESHISANKYGMILCIIEFISFVIPNIYNEYKFADLDANLSLLGFNLVAKHKYPNFLK